MSTRDEERTWVVQLTAAELRAIIREELEMAFATLRRARWVDIAQAAASFDVTPATIRTWIRRGAPAMQVGSLARPLYRLELEQVEKWLRAQR